MIDATGTNQNRVGIFMVLGFNRLIIRKLFAKTSLLNDPHTLKKRKLPIRRFNIEIFVKNNKNNP